MNYYEILDITRDADKPQIKRAYFSMVKSHSPDKDPEGFKAIRLAYETLYDDKKRAEYDTYFNAAGDAQTELLTARELLRQNKYKEAVEYLAALIAEHPTEANAEVMRLYASALWQCRKSGKAEDICKALLAKNPQDVETLLLRGGIAASRGHTNKAYGYYNDAVTLDPTYPKAWVQYMQYLLNHQPWRVTDAGMQAVRLNPDVFRDDYILYLHCVCNGVNQVFSLFDAFDESDIPEELAASPKFKDTARMLLQCFSLFTECFINDPHHSQARYKSVLNALPCVIKKPTYHPYIEKLLTALEQSRYYNKKDDVEFNNFRAAIVMQALHADERIHDVLADLTGCLLAGESDPAERFSMEFFIVNEIPDIRKYIKALRKEYPEYFKLNSAFYLDVLNPRKTEFLTDKYYGLYKRFLNNENAFAIEDDNDDDLDDIDDNDDSAFAHDSPEAEKPYVRETPKVGRNDPCPCGSGKKYKRCCGR